MKKDTLVVVHQVRILGYLPLGRIPEKIMGYEKERLQLKLRWQWANCVKNRLQKLMNILILTAGASGSSEITQLYSLNGFWTVA